MRNADFPQVISPCASVEKVYKPQKSALSV
jgi:hypothetical protein